MSDDGVGVLTPRRKIQALLAAIDDDSDTETRTIDDDEPQTNLNADKNEAIEISTNTIESQSSNDSDEDELPIIPHGRLAAKLFAQREATANKAGREDDSDDDGNAYERIKRQLMGDHGAAESAKTINSDSGEDGLEKPSLKPRRRKLHSRLAQTAKESVERSSPKLPPNPQESSFKNPFANDSDSDLPQSSSGHANLAALVARKRRERLEKEREEAKKKEARAARLDALSQKVASNGGHTGFSESDSDSEEELKDRQRLTMSSRPTRMASKKAMEELKRETQRMERNMQLAHEARTKKKITKESLFARFNFHPAATSSEPSLQDMADNEAAPATVLQPGAEKSTPPPSSPLANEIQQKPKGLTLNDLAERLVPRESRLKKDNGGDIATHEESTTTPSKSAEAKERLVKTNDEGQLKLKKPFSIRAVIRSKTLANTGVELSSDSSSSDDELEIVDDPKKKSKNLSILDRIPERKTQANQSLQALRMLAQLSSPSRKADNARATMTPAEMEVLLRRRAREQANQERAEKLQRLKEQNPNLVFETPEEIERRQMEIEDLVEKAREEAEEIAKREKEAEKIEKQGFVDELDDSEEDDDYEDSEEEDLDIKLSDDEEPNGDDEDGGVKLPVANDESNNVVTNPSTSGEANEAFEDPDASSEEEVISMLPTRRGRIRHIVEDDEDNPLQVRSTPVTPPTGLSAAADILIPGLPMSDDAPMGLTQAFAATMADGEEAGTGDDDAMQIDNEHEQSSLGLFHGVPDFNPPALEFAHFASQKFVTDSQPGLADPKADEIHMSQLQLDSQDLERHRDTTRPAWPSTAQTSEMPRMTQDVGFENKTPLANRFSPTPDPTPSSRPSRAISDSPTIKKHRRLRRRNDASPSAASRFPGTVADAGDDDENNLSTIDDVFALMKAVARQRRRLSNTPFDKTNSKAKELVEEQAEESDDEFRGLGGPSDDEADERDGAQADADIANLINDNSKEEINERTLAALHADQERIADEKQISKLYNDISKGLLRRRHRAGGGDLDLSDSEDEMERKRRIKRARFAKMQKALLATDENVGKIADNPKKKAFFDTLNDVEMDDDLFILDDTAKEEEPMVATTNEYDGVLQNVDSNMASVAVESESVDDNDVNPLKRKHARISRKPTSLAEIRETLSFLMETRDSGTPSEASLEADVGSDNERPSNSDKNNDKNKNNPFAPLPKRHPEERVIDRIQLQRSETASASRAGDVTTNTNTTTSTSSNAFTGFCVPKLMSRFVSSGSISAIALTERAAGGGEERIGMRRAAQGRKNAVSFYSKDRGHEQEQEQEQEEQDGERQRKGERRKKAKRGGVGLLRSLVMADSGFE